MKGNKMEIDLNKYKLVKETNDDNKIIIVYQKKVIECFACLKQVTYRRIRQVRYPLIVKGMGRVIMTKNCCSSCYDEVMEIKNNLKYN